MPRYDDRYSSCRLYVGRLSSRTRSRDLERLFSRYGRIRDVDMKRDYAFIDFSDPREADDARYRLDGREFEGSRITVEFAKGTPRGSREYSSKGPPPGTGRCFNCGVDGHWARDCTAGDWKNKCYRCGERGHIERSCKNSPKKLRRGDSYSRSPVRSCSPRRRSRSPRRRSRSPRRRSRSPRRVSRSPRPRRSHSRSQSYSSGRSYSHDRSYSRSRSPRRDVEPAERIRSPKPVNNSPLSEDRKRRPTADERSHVKRYSPIPDERSPVKRYSPEANEQKSPSPAREGSPMRREESPNDANGRDRSFSPRDDRSPVEDD